MVGEYGCGVVWWCAGVQRVVLVLCCAVIFAKKQTLSRTRRNKWRQRRILFLFDVCLVLSGGRVVYGVRWLRGGVSLCDLQKKRFPGEEDKAAESSGGSSFRLLLCILSLVLSLQ